MSAIYSNSQGTCFVTMCPPCEISGSHGDEYEVYRVFWSVAQCSHVEVDRRFRGAYCLHHQDDDSSPLKRRSTSTWLHGATSQKTLNFMCSPIVHNFPLLYHEGFESSKKILSTFCHTFIIREKSHFGNVMRMT
jgi:hypothetical protein